MVRVLFMNFRQNKCLRSSSFSVHNISFFAVLAEHIPDEIGLSAVLNLVFDLVTLGLEHLKLLLITVLN